MLNNSDSPNQLTELDGELKPISFIELEKMKTSHGDLYWKKGNNKLVKLLHSGDYLDFSKIEKFKKVTEHLYISQLCDESFIARGKELLGSLLATPDERVRLSLRAEFLEHISPVYWDGDRDGSLLSLAIIFKESFYKISPEFEEEMDRHALSILRRAGLYSSIVTLFALCLGYTHGSFLRDLFNISFFNDYSYSKKIYGDSDNVNPSHATESLEAFKDSKLYDLKNKNLSKLIKFHHEEFKGNGELVGLNFNELSDVEKISIFVEKSLSYSEYEFSKNDGTGLLKKVLEEGKEEGLFVKSFKAELISIFLEIENKGQAAS